VSVDPTQVTPPPPSPDGSTPPPNGAEVDPLAGKTVEDVDRDWRYRVGQKDRAHAAAEQALRDQIASLEAQNKARGQQAGGQSSGQAPATGEDPQLAFLREQLATAKQETEAERKLRIVETRRAKYPHLSKQVGNDTSIFEADEATLARLNAQLDDEANVSPLAPTSPRKGAPAPAKNVNDMTKAELEAEMKRQLERGDHQRQ
jgi:hypothetical protein